MTYKDDHYQPKTSAAVERLKFHSRVRKSNESVATFTCQLRELSQFCDFGENLEEMLNDRVICGIGDTRMQRRLLSEGPDLSKSKDIVPALEAADANAGQVETTIQPPQPQINSLHKGHVSKSRSTQAPPPPCYRCGGSHSHQVCRFQDSTCHKRGHIAKVWGDLEQEHLLEAKQLLTSPRLLVHFDPAKDLVLSCDASADGGYSCYLIH